MEEVERNYRMLMSSFLVVFALYNCQHKTENNNQINNTNLENKIEDFKPEISINKLLYLRDDTSLEKFYPNYKNLIAIDKIRETSVIIFANKTSKEYLLAYKYEGDIKNSFSMFEIGYLQNSPELKHFTTTNYNNFHTELGLTLGMSVDDLIKLKGENFKIENNSKGKILKYEISNPNNLYVKKYEMPPYFMDFYLKNEKVYLIIFGFEYP